MARSTHRIDRAVWTHPRSLNWQSGWLKLSAMTIRHDSSAQRPDSTVAAAGAPEVAPAPSAAPASHDSETPPALVSFMLTHWKPAPDRLPGKLKRAEVFAARRRALSARFP